ncbi:MAG: hypothetical protein E7578_01735 [Ruminococcaceae bacterium]|nr:hypothetical protein [Oscillospiraceae bacterium]
MADFSFTGSEMQVMMIAMLLYRDMINDDLDDMELDDPERGIAIDQNKLSNSVIRKLKSIMNENGVEILEP